MDLNALNVVTTAMLPEEPGDPNDPKIKLSDSKKIKSGAFSKKHIEGIIRASREVGIDPNKALALAWQESGFATEKGKTGRRGFVATPSLGQVHDFEPAQEKELQEVSQKSGIDPMYLKVVIALRDKIKYAKQLGFKDEASQLQAYNGYGTITKKQFGGADKAYGVPIGEGINMKKNPLYGKRLLELASDISKNKEVYDLVNFIQNEKIKKTAQDTYKNTQAIKSSPMSANQVAKK
jgi:hypothetical protein